MALPNKSTVTVPFATSLTRPATASATANPCLRPACGPTKKRTNGATGLSLRRGALRLAAALARCARLAFGTFAAAFALAATAALALAGLSARGFRAALALRFAFAFALGLNGFAGFAGLAGLAGLGIARGGGGFVGARFTSTRRCLGGRGALGSRRARVGRVGIDRRLGYAVRF